MEVASGAPAARPSRWRAVAVVLVQLVCVALVAHALWDNRHELTNLPRVAVGPFLLLFVLNLLGHLQRTVEFTYMLRKLGVREPFGEGFLLTGAGYLLNHLPLNAGLVMRAVVLRRDHALPYSSYLSLTMVSIVVNLGVGAAVAALVLGLGGEATSAKSLAITGLGMVMLSCLVTLYFPEVRLPEGLGWVGRQLSLLLQGVKVIRGSGGALALLAVLSATKIVALTLRFALCWYVLGRPISLRAALLVSVAHNLLVLINVTPGNLGVRELMISVLSGELGSSRTIGLAAASIERAVSLTYTVVVGLPGLHSLRNRARAAQPS